MKRSLLPGSARIIRGEGSTLFDENENEYIDLSSAFGTIWLGHGNRALRRRVAKQLDLIWSGGILETEVIESAKSAVNSFFPDTHRIATIYSTGTEASEFAIRLSRAATGRNELIGFEGGMHGKSLVTSHMGWDNRDGLDLPGVHRLPFVSTTPETEIIRQFATILNSRTVAAVFVEPIQGSAGGHRASDDFYRRINEICRETETLLVFDELVTGFWRTGLPFHFSGLGFVPDVILVGKGMGNGFPVSGVVVTSAITIEPRMFPGTTYSDNPLAASAVAATLEQMHELDLPALVQNIESIIIQSLSPLEETGATLRGRGALWILELPQGVELEAVIRRIYQRGVAVSFAGSYIRVLPAATREAEQLEEACCVLAEEVTRACSYARSVKSAEEL